MDIYIGLLLIGVGGYLIKGAEQRQRIALLGSHLKPFQLEKLMENLTQGYLRALGESDPERSEPIWRMLDGTERALSEQFQRLAADIARMDPAQARVSRWPLGLPLASRLFPATTFDLREAVALHARGFAGAVQNTQGLSRKARAFTLSAELFLFQHTCHWYCRSKAVASARLMARHQTRHDQVLAAVSPATREGYLALLRG